MKDLEFPGESGISQVGFSLICAVFGSNGEMYYDPQKDEVFFSIGMPTKRNIKIENTYFEIGNKTPIDGIIYSNIRKEDLFWECYNSEENNITKPSFLFIQNPEKEDLSYLFPFCKKMAYPCR